VKEWLKETFSEISNRYTITNHMMTAGFDILWRRRLRNFIGSSISGLWLDLCTGTGDTLMTLYPLAKKGTTIFAVDFSKRMLDVAKIRCREMEVTFLLGDAFRLPFKDEVFDLLTLSLALRNLHSRSEGLVRAFREFFRVLKRGGKVVMLETGHPENSLIKGVFRSYVRHIIPVVGGILTGEREGYKYLAHSILDFPKRETIGKMLEDSGFKEVKIHLLTLGFATIYSGRK
jgi:demethylmenaquinone methyltransferase/2-methoxy-6-polyprenyl-1,4-benzoquinol methylase